MHYTRDEWVEFKRGRVSPEERLRMEEHMGSCQKCFETYILTIDSRDEELASLLLPAGFAMEVIRGMVPREGGQSVAKTRRSLVVQYYAAAAMITAILFAGGWFDALSREIPSALKETTKVIRHIDESVPSGWSQSIADGFSAWISRLMR